MDASVQVFAFVFGFFVSWSQSYDNANRKGVKWVSGSMAGIPKRWSKFPKSGCENISWIGLIAIVQQFSKYGHLSILSIIPLIIRNCKIRTNEFLRNVHQTS